MKIRASVHLNDNDFELLIVPVLQETDDHLALKLAACLFFAGRSPVLTQGANHPALMGQEYWPDLLGVDVAGSVSLWIECGKTTPHKLEKVTRRFRDARVLVLTALPREGEQMVQTLEAEGNDRVEVWTFQEGEYARWRSLVGESNDIIGEATESSMNLVINNELFLTDLRRLNGV